MSILRQSMVILLVSILSLLQWCLLAQSKYLEMYLEDHIKHPHDTEMKYLKHSAFKYFGKAYVITTDRRLSDTVIQAAKAVGFDPVIVEADRPYKNIYPTTKSFTSHCFGGENVEQPANMFPGEVALVGSHRKAIKAIASDNTTFDDDWSLILESDARIHPDVLNAREMVAEAIINQKIGNSYGFMYLGACSPKCQKPGESFSDGCVGYCTHALAMTKKRAQTLFEELYCTDATKTKKAPCGCHKPMCHTDQVLVHHFKDPVRNEYEKFILPRAMLVGAHYQSPHIPDHYGVLYQCCRDEALIKSGNGSSLKVVALIDAPPLDCYNTRLDGRMGNLLFEYASLIGICVKKGYNPDYCAGLPLSDITGNRLDLPVEEFREVFNLPQVVCPINENMTYHEHPDDQYAIKFDPLVFEQPPGTKFYGYLQSYKYFHPHAQTHIKRKFQFPEYVKKQGDEFLRLVHRRVHDLDNQKNITCVHVRRGDKARTIMNEANTTIYNAWALSTDFYLKAISYARTWNENLNLVFFVGGGFQRSETGEDRRWVRDTLMSYAMENDKVFIAPDVMSHIVVMYTLTQCNHLIISSSSFSWWAGYLSDHASLIIAPKYLHVVERVGFVPEDHYLPEWILLDKDSTVPPRQWGK